MQTNLIFDLLIKNHFDKRFTVLIKEILTFFKMVN